MAIKRFGVSLEDSLLEELDTYVDGNGFANRSQAIRFLIEKNVAERKWQCNHIVAGTIVILYEQEKKDITSRISTIEGMFRHVVLSSVSHYINQGNCLHVTAVMGEAHTLTELADKLTTIKGIRHGKLVMGRAD